MILIHSQYILIINIAEPTTNLRSLVGDLDLLGLVTKAIKVYEAINDDDEE